MEGVFDLDRRCSTSRSWPSCSSASPRTRRRSSSPAASRPPADPRLRRRPRGVGADLRALGARLLAFYGQHEHRKLTLTSAQGEILDGFAGAEQLELRERYRAAHRAVVALGASCDELREREGARERDLDLMRFELDEIEEVGPDPGEQRGADRRARPAAPRRGPARGPGRGGALAGARRRCEDGGGAAARWPRPRRARAAASSGSTRARRARRARRPPRSSSATSARELRCYLEGSRPSRAGSRGRGAARRARPAAAQARGQRSRRCSPTPSIAARRSSASSGRRSARGELERRGSPRPSAERAEARRQLRSRARRRRRGSSGRSPPSWPSWRWTAPRLEVALSPVRTGSGRAGARRVELRVATNPGMPIAPLRDAASGGELSRVMLALTGLGAGRRSRRSSSTRSTPASAARSRAGSVSGCGRSARAGR